jgi:hypothetical protein
MVDYNVVFYLGAHYHTYERIYPYLRGGNFTLIPQPYSLTPSTKYLPSIVEGIAGNDKSIVDSYGKLSNFTAALSYNITGFGIMKASPIKLSYDHYTSKEYGKPVDTMTIFYNQLFGRPKNYLRK